MKGRQVTDFNNAYMALFEGNDFVWIEEANCLHLVIKEAVLKKAFEGHEQQTRSQLHNFARLYTLQGVRMPSCNCTQMDFEQLRGLIAKADPDVTFG